MRSIILATSLLFFLSHSGPAYASDSMRLAEDGGFLLGNAHRCGVADLRVARAGRLLRGLIDDAAATPIEQRAAQLRFAEMFVAAAKPHEAGRLSPSCKLVVDQFSRLERFHREAGLN